MVIFIFVPVVVPLVMWQFSKIKNSAFYDCVKIMRRILAFIIGLQIISALFKTQDWIFFLK